MADDADGPQRSPMAPMGPANPANPMQLGTLTMALDNVGGKPQMTSQKTKQQLDDAVAKYTKEINDDDDEEEEGDDDEFHWSSKKIPLVERANFGVGLGVVIILNAVFIGLE